jgi:esterase
VAQAGAHGLTDSGLPPETYLATLSSAAKRSGMAVPVVRPADRHVLADRTRLHLVDWGDTRGARVLLLHGTGLTAHTWDLVALGLRGAGWHCVAPDLRGHGDSEWSPGMHYAIDDHVADIRALLAIMADRPTVLVGMSLGGLVGLRIAAGAPPALRAIVVVDTTPDLLLPMSPEESADDLGRSRIGSFLSEAPVLDSVEEFVQRALVFNPRRDAESLRVTLRHNLRQLADGRWTWKYDARPYQSGVIPANPSAEELWRDARRIRVPACVVRGVDSQVLSPSGATKLADALRGSVVGEVPQAGHSCHSDNPPGFLAVVKPFLAAVFGG